MDIRHTWQEWDSITGSRILDPDGFRLNPSPDGLYTRDEFEARLPLCTARFLPPPKREPVKVDYSNRCSECGAKFEEHGGPMLSCPR